MNVGSMLHLDNMNNLKFELYDFYVEIHNIGFSLTLKIMKTAVG
ncbi:11428_t:CDS:2 [Funneliformis mosseae]|uniref:11428_t:CDS:1 n=1 Tax=Funneliformis mosseae TaxID=27381 RepID=A0A9N8VLH2_FUNMO|nr:11428_t:CDS:2 [Funneliformis mosseae]